jgi:hypothetical protein
MTACRLEHLAMSLGVLLFDPARCRRIGLEENGHDDFGHTCPKS